MRTKSAPDEGSASAERNPSPAFASRRHPLLQGERGRCRLICPTGCLPLPLSSPICKNISLRRQVETALFIPHVPPDKRGVRDRHERWGGMRWTRQRRARECDRRAGFPVSDRTARRTNGADPPSLKLRRTWHKPVEASWRRRCCGRQNRVVLAPVAGVKSAEVLRAQPGLAQTLQSADDGDKTNSSPGRARNKPLKPLRAGMPGDSGEPAVTTVCLPTTAHGLRVHRAPGIPRALLSSWGGPFAPNPGVSCRESADPWPDMGAAAG